MVFPSHSFWTVVPAALTTLVGVHPAAAQQDTTRLLPAIVVTAHRQPTAPDLVTSRVTVLRGDALAARGITTVVDALRAVPGLAVVETGPFGSTASVFSRGGESDYVQVMVDGVPVNEPGGSYELAHLTLANVERVEVLRGPAGVLYGSDAVTGVVQIFTRAGTDGARASASVRGGAYGTLDAAAALAGGGDRAGYSLGLSHRRSDGTYAFNNDYRNTTASGRFRVAPDERTTVNLTLRYTDARFHFPTDGSGLPVDSNQFTANEATTVGVELVRTFSPRVEGRLHLSLNDIGKLFDDEQDGPADTIGFFAFRSQTELRTRGADGRLHFRLTPSTVLTAGAAIDQEWQRTDRDRTRINRAYYVQAIGAAPFGLTGNAGVRIDDNERFGTFVTFRAGVGYRVRPLGTRLTASFGTGFKEPTFLETFDAAFSVGNAALDPERSRSWEIGVEQPVLARLLVAGTYFDQRFRDLIQFTFAPPSPGDPNYFNVAAADARGIELEVRAVPLPGLRLSGGYTYVETVVTDSGFDAGPDAAFVVGDRLLRRPAHLLNALASYHVLGRATVGAGIRFAGARDDRDFSSFPTARVELPAYTVMDASLEVLLARPRVGRPGVALTARVENLFDRVYQEIVGFPARGRVLWVGGRLEK